ncbi:histidine kinase N-terminal domain-containing protein, partial [Mycobacterium tuberculosis]|nr:histidine kinase N-terminal domain-containing protein [Mycobacterium tuberculosis]
GPTLFNRDLLGARATGLEKDLLGAAVRSGELVTEVAPARCLGVGVGTEETEVCAEAVPLVRHGETIAILVRYSEDLRRRGSSRLEKHYREAAMALLTMIAQGA